MAKHDIVLGELTWRSKHKRIFLDFSLGNLRFITNPGQEIEQMRRQGRKSIQDLKRHKENEYNCMQKGGRRERENVTDDAGDGEAA